MATTEIMGAGLMQVMFSKMATHVCRGKEGRGEKAEGE